jgi:beta-N-acetylhexosaminidase
MPAHGGASLLSAFAVLVNSVHLSPQTLPKRVPISVVDKALPTLQEKVGQMLQIQIHADYEDIKAPALVAEMSRVAKYHVGSVDLRVHRYGENLIRPRPETVAKVLNVMQANSSLPLLVGSDIERGLIARVAGSPDGPLVMTYGASGDSVAARRLGEITGREARGLGIHWAFAPVTDVNDDPENSIIGDRSFGENMQEVGKMVEAYIRGAHAGGMLVTAKHFPGHGGTSMDSHVGIVTLNQSLDHLRSVEFVPFRSAIAAGVDAIMLAHERVPALDPDTNKIATNSSRIIQGYLRGELGFKGIVITDAMEMRGLTDLYQGNPNPVAQATVDAVKAGADIVMLPDHVDEAYQAILAAVRSGEIPESRIDESVQRIMAMKEKAGLFKNRFVDESKVSAVFSRKEDFDFAQRAADDGVVLVRNNGSGLPIPRVSPGLRLAPKRKLLAVLFTDSESSPLGHAFAEEIKSRRPDAEVIHIYYDNRTEPLRSDIFDAVRSADDVVVGAFMTNLPGRKAVAGGRIVNVFGMTGICAEVFGQILEIGGKKVIVVSFGSPYLILHYHSIQNYVCTFSVSSTSERAAVKALFGEIHNHARLPISLPGVANIGFAINWPQSRLSFEGISH